jgi:hypothetical protein
MLESEVRQNQALIHQIYQLKDKLDEERQIKDNLKKDAEKCSTELAKIRLVFEPMSL